MRASHLEGVTGRDGTFRGLLRLDRRVAGPIDFGPVVATDEDHGLALAGELLVTNASALAAELGMAERRGDGYVVLAAYRRWGDGLLERLDGDYSLALWDGRRRRLLCGRDALGVKPFYYHLGPRWMAFGSDAAALFGLAEVPRRLDAGAVVDYLTLTFDDRVSTGYLDVKRLAPGQSMVVEADRAELRTFWRPDPVDELRLGTDGEYEEAFRDALTQAVAGRALRQAAPEPGSGPEPGPGRGPVGVSLSGGLDSSAVACLAGVAGARPLHAYSAVYPDDPASDERRWASAVVEACGARPRVCDADATSPLATWEGAPWLGPVPACDPQVAVTRVTLEAAAADGVPVVLHGFGGDSVVSHGLERLAELVGSGRVVRAVAEANTLGRRGELSRRRMLTSYGLAPFVPNRARRPWHRWRPDAAGGPPNLLRTGVATRVGRGDRPAQAMARSARQAHVADVGAGIQPHVLEAGHRVDQAVGVERRYPFFDRRLVELCLSLPADQKLRDGWTRSIMRRALTGVVPDEVLRRPGKGDLGPGFVRALATTDRQALDAVVASPGAVAEWVDPEALAALWQRCQAGAGEGAWFALWRVAVTARWLSHHGFDA